MFEKTKAKLSDLHDDILSLSRSLGSLDEHTESTVIGYASRSLKNVMRAGYLRVRYGKGVAAPDVDPEQLQDL